jgi:hypothetical protein
VAAGPIAIPNKRLLVKPYLDGTATVNAGTIECRAPRLLPGWSAGPSVVLTDADINLNLNASGNASIVTVTLPASVQAFVDKNPTKTQVRIVGLTMKAASGPYLGESFASNILSVWEPNDPADFQNTIVHELGHFFGQTLDPTEVTAMSAAGIPNILTYYQSYLDINDPTDNRGSGPHCRTAATAYVQSGRNGYRNGKCVMYESGPIPGAYNRYCDTCHPYLLVTDMAK